MDNSKRLWQELTEEQSQELGKLLDRISHVCASLQGKITSGVLLFPLEGEQTESFIWDVSSNEARRANEIYLLKLYFLQLIPLMLTYATRDFREVIKERGIRIPPELEKILFSERTIPPIFAEELKAVLPEIMRALFSDEKDTNNTQQGENDGRLRHDLLPLKRP